MEPERPLPLLPGSAITIVSLTLAVIGGSFFPTTQGPEFMSQLSLLAPHAWFLDAVNDISTGGDLGSSITAIIVLLAVGAGKGVLYLVSGVLILTFATTAISGYILSTIFVSRDQDSEISWTSSWVTRREPSMEATASSTRMQTPSSASAGDAPR